ncbi:MAG: TetR/AcrR family transcriptional regulator [Gemmobacter sp.]
MQEVKPRTQAERTDATRAALIAAARALFVSKGFADTGTPEIVAAAGVTRGALYHHFADKTDLFAAVIRAEAQAISDAIRTADLARADPIEALIRGGRAFLAALAAPGRVRLMLVDAPSVLGHDRMAEIDAGSGAVTLEEGLSAAMAAGAMPKGPVAPLAQALSAAYDRAALALAAGGDPAGWDTALARLIGGLRAAGLPADAARQAPQDRGP